MESNPLVAEIQDKDAQIERLSTLLVRAADALQYSPAESHVHLIAELRKALK